MSDPARTSRRYEQPQRQPKVSSRHVGDAVCDGASGYWDTGRRAVRGRSSGLVRYSLRRAVAGRMFAAIRPGVKAMRFPRATAPTTTMRMLAIGTGCVTGMPSEWAVVAQSHRPATTPTGMATISAAPTSVRGLCEHGGADLAAGETEGLEQGKVASVLSDGRDEQVGGGSDGECDEEQCEVQRCAGEVFVAGGIVRSLRTEHGSVPRV